MIILTGSKGFIGQNFKNKIKSKLIEVDIDNCWDFLEFFDEWKNVDLILHQGAISSTTETDIRKIYSYNIDYTLRLFEFAKKYRIPVKYASSASVYGNQQNFFNPLNYYAVSKLLIDYWVKENINEFPLIQGFRYFNVYGKYEDHKIKLNQSSPISKFINNSQILGKIQIFDGSDKFYRDFICVDDVVEIVLNNTKQSGIYDLGTSCPVSFQYVAECVSKKYGSNIEYIPFPKHLDGKYQKYTCAKMEWLDYKFISVEEYLK